MAKRNNIKKSQETATMPETLGGILKAAREKRRLSPEEIHDRTRIPLASISLLEEDRWEDLPAPVYVRGFIKLFAREVGLEYNEIIGRYPAHQQVAPSLAKTSVPLLDSFSPSAAKDEKNEERESRVSTGLVVFILLILATLAISYFASQRANESSSSPSASEMANFDVTG